MVILSRRISPRRDTAGKEHLARVELLPPWSLRLHGPAGLN
jgi:hypothetical protein